ncbi:MAG: hypothetical protein FWD71_05780 [Oscillospiraceae bacterium]|nr:hypothetical protein [Oscillospiraceae bacterium]
MVRKFCPKCRTIQNMNVSDFKKIGKDKNNKDIEVIIKSYQCSVCHIFVQSEEDKAPIV